MRRLRFTILETSCLFLLLFSLFSKTAFAQFENATISGQVVDSSGLRLPGAQIRLVDIERETASSATTNNSGLYTFSSIRPGRYRMEVSAAGFRIVNVTGLTVNVQDHLEQNFKLVVGSVSESVTVEGGASIVDTESAAVSTVVDRNFAENLPLNGRSFQTLIQLTPGVVLNSSTGYDSGQFSVNGQRAASNYWTVDGVSANIGIGANLTNGSGVAGALASFSAQGGTNSLVSVDALQEFRIQTSTFAPEFGRSPGAQISILTRSGTNGFHGTAFDYLRNDVFDANDWFNGINILNSTPIPKAQERQNDFGGVFGGPIVKDRTFFFFSYEGLRLRLPQTSFTTVPDLATRQTAIPAMQPFLNAFPFDPKQTDLGNGIAQFSASFSNRSALNAYSLRIDHRLNAKLSLFGRYNFSPSNLIQRGAGGADALSTLQTTKVTTKTFTVGATWLISPAITSDVRFNYSRNAASNSYTLDAFGGATPISTSNLPLPSPFTLDNSAIQLTVFDLTAGTLFSGQGPHNVQRQFNFVYDLSAQKGPHSLKFGIDYRRLSPSLAPATYAQATGFSDEASAGAGQFAFAEPMTSQTVDLLLHNVGVFAQDTWRVQPRLTLTYGLRWDLDVSPESTRGPSLPAVVNFNDPANLDLAPAGTPPYSTRYGNLAPRVGLAYQVSQSQAWQTVVRGGFGVFFDLASTELGNTTFSSTYPFGGFSVLFGGNYPSDVVAAPLPTITPSNLGFAFDPNLKLPSTLEWNVAFEQELGSQQTISASYIGSSGRRLIQTEGVFAPNPQFATVYLVGNHGTSNYGALQLQYQRRLSRGLQALASYTWSHSIDTGSTSSIGVGGSLYFSQLGADANRGPSDFDVRNAASLGMTYDVPFSWRNPLSRALLKGWSLQNIFQARSAPPVDLYYGYYAYILDGNPQYVRPDIISGVPLYLYGSRYPDGKAINNTPAAVVGGCPDGSQSIGAFCPPPTIPNTNTALRQGDLGRNALRGFGAWQWDFGVHRDFRLREALKLQFRAEMFNVLNHPNFGSPYGNLSSTSFGISTQMLGQSLSGGNVGGGAFSPLYQFGGPRSMQIAVKLQF